MTTIGLAFLAGVLSILSPCVLPLLPLVLGAAASEHRLGPLALAGGLASSFTTIGLFVATIGYAIGFDGDVFRFGGAVMMIGIGLVLAVPALQQRLAAAGGPAANWMEQRFGGFSSSGWKGQLAVGVLLGAVWSPCVGPTLGAASLLAARRENLVEVALTMLAFGLGTGAPLALLGSLSRQALMGVRNRLMAAGKGVKALFGAFFVLIGLSIVTNADKAIETFLVDVSPAWLTDLTTRF